MNQQNDDQRVYQGSVQPKNFPGLPKDWTSEWETFPSSEGLLQLYSAIHHKKEWHGNRVLVVLHGFGEHGGRYVHFPHYLQSTVDAVYTLDLRGHGRSEGLRGHVNKFELFAEDAALAINRLDESLKKRFGGKAEIHLFGHSMGGLIALQTLFQFPNLPLRSVTVSAPLLGITAKVPKVKKFVGTLMSRVWGSLQMEAELDASFLSHDQDVVIAYQTDRLVHSKITPRLFIGMEKAMAQTLKLESGLNYPVQFILPLQDHVVDSNLSLAFYRKLKLREKGLKTYPNFFHESHNEIGKEQAFNDIISWIKAYSTVS